MSDTIENNLDELRTGATIMMQLMAFVVMGFFVLLHVIISFVWGGVLALGNDAGLLDSSLPLLTSWTFARISVGIPFLILTCLTLYRMALFRMAVPKDPTEAAAMAVRDMTKSDDFEPVEFTFGHPLREAVASMAQKARIPVPRVYCCPLPILNAFASCARDGDAFIVVFAKVFKFPPELALAILAHEIGHISNKDMRRDRMMFHVVAAMGCIFTTGIELYQKKSRESLIGRDPDEPLAGAAAKAVLCVIAGVVLILVGWLPWSFANGLMWWRRYTAEYLADAAGAKFLGDRQAMADMLVNLHYNTYGRRGARETPVHASRVGAGYVFDEHPPGIGRVKRLAPDFKGDWESMYRAVAARHRLINV